jgi:hypothetical protein
MLSSLLGYDTSSVNRSEHCRVNSVCHGDSGQIHFLASRPIASRATWADASGHEVRLIAVV